MRTTNLVIIILSILAFFWSLWFFSNYPKEKPQVTEQKISKEQLRIEKVDKDKQDCLDYGMRYIYTSGGSIECKVIKKR